MSCPDEIQEVLKSVFGFPSQLLFASVASVKGGEANIRTMRVYDIDQGCPILLTHTGSTKWGEFREGGYAALCLVSEDKLTQIIVRGQVELRTAEEDPKRGALYWERVRGDVRNIYDPNYPVDQPCAHLMPAAAPEKPTKTFGMVQVIPDFWEKLDLASCYTESLRFHFTKEKGRWTKTQMTVA